MQSNSKTTLVIDLTTDRVIWFTSDELFKVEKPDEHSALYEFTGELPEKMKPTNCFNYKLVRDKLVLAVSKNKTEASLLDTNKSAVIAEVKRLVSLRSSKYMSNTRAGEQSRRHKLHQAEQFLKGNTKNTRWLEAVSARLGGTMSMEDAAKFVVAKNQERTDSLFRIEKARAVAMHAIESADSSSKVFEALAAFKEAAK